MKAFEITNQKRLMQMLLSEETFDGFLLNEATIVKGAAMTIEGGTKDGTTSAYKGLRPVVFEFIKGKQTPSYMKFVLLAAENEEGVSTKAINILYRDGRMTVTTGVALSGFTLDKTIENQWDLYVEDFLKSNLVDIEFLG